jgi:pyruvate ferredoxin oxidoreductase beta subunit
MATKLSLKEIAKRPERLGPGHRLCAGCAGPIVVRQILNAIEEPVVVFNATGCLEVATTIYPFTAWRVPWMHSAFENAAATCSGAEAMYRSLVRQGKLPERDLRFIAFGGDGGTYDIGLQSLSGAAERGHRFMYVCYDNGAYMNTGIQRSSATPFGAATTTSPAGSKIAGKQQVRKDLATIMAAHHIPYVAQSAPHRWKDLMGKARRGAAADGPAFLNVLSPCNRGWRTETDEALESSRLAVDSCAWPLFEVIDGQWKLSYKPREKLPVARWLETEGRFAHLFRPQNRPMIEKIQAQVDAAWHELLQRCGEA